MIAHVESKKMIQMNLFTKQKDSRTSKNKFIVTKSEGEVEERDNLYFGTNIYTLLYFHGQRSLAGYSTRGRKESDRTEQLTHTKNSQQYSTGIEYSTL